MNYGWRVESANGAVAVQETLQRFEREEFQIFQIVHEEGSTYTVIGRSQR